MDFAVLQSAFDAVSIVVWFALLVVVFAVFVGLGIYAGARDRNTGRTQQNAPDERSPRPRPADLRRACPQPQRQETP